MNNLIHSKFWRDIIKRSKFLNKVLMNFDVNELHHNVQGFLIWDLICVSSFNYINAYHRNMCLYFNESQAIQAQSDLSVCLQVFILNDTKFEQRYVLVSTEFFYRMKLKFLCFITFQYS